MQELFRFAVVRPPLPAAAGCERVILFPPTPTLLRSNLEAALTHPTPRQRMLDLADAFLASAEFSAAPATLEFAPALLRMHRIMPALESISLAGLGVEVQAVFGLTAAQVLQAPAFRQTRERLFDAILALRMRPRAYPKLLPVYAALLRMSDLIEQIALADSSLDCATPMQVLGRSIVLPPGLFPLPKPIVEERPSRDSAPNRLGEVAPPVNMALIKVMHQLVRYEGDEISHTESALQCESVARETRRLRRSDKRPEHGPVHATEQERDKQTTERHEMESEIDRSIAERERFEIGGAISASYGPLKTAVNTKFESEVAIYKADRTATKYARELVEHARKRVIKHLHAQRNHANLEEFEEKYLHSLDNSSGGEVFNGVYRWLTKTFAAEVRDFGVRTMFEIHAPEPAAMVRPNRRARAADPLPGPPLGDQARSELGRVRSSLRRDRDPSAARALHHGLGLAQL